MTDSRENMQVKPGKAFVGLGKFVVQSETVKEIGLYITVYISRHKEAIPLNTEALF